MRIAAIDVGTNTVLVLVADVAPDGTLTVLADEERFARLGEGVDAHGHLTEAAMDRVLDRLAASKATAERLGAERVVIGATSASRDARNGNVLVERVQRELGLDYRIRSGQEEALLTFEGALALVPGVDAACVLDIGGGSTEWVLGRAGAAPTYRISLDIGSVRLTERCFSTLPPSGAERRAATALVDAALDAIPDGLPQGHVLVEGGGTARVLTVLAGLPGGAPSVPASVVEAWCERLLSLPPSEVLALAPDVLAGREDVTGTAALILDTVMRRFGFDAFIASPGGFRHGLALEAARRG